MKPSRLAGLVLSTFAALALQRSAAQTNYLDLSLYTSGGVGFYTNTFDSLGYSTNQTVDGNLPTGLNGGYLAGEWSCYIGGTANYFGTPAGGAPNGTSPGSMNNWTN